MPFFAPVIGWLFTALVSFFGRWLVLEKALKVAFAVMLLALMVSMFTSMRSCVDGVCAAAISGMGSSHHNFAVGLGVVFNSITMAAVGAYITVWVACQLYVVKKRFVDLLA